MHSEFASVHQKGNSPAASEHAVFRKR